MAEICKLTKGDECPSLRTTSCAFGVFDGVHKGHQFLIQQAIDATPENGQSVIITFDRDPDELFHPESFKKLQTNEQRIHTLANTGVDRVVVLEFTEEFAHTHPDDFLATLFALGVPDHLHVGSNIHFGRYGAGTLDDLIAYGAATGMDVHPYELLRIDGQPVSSTRIRSFLASAQLEKAQAFLGHAYTLSGVVQKGRGDGVKLGFPTANLVIDQQLMPLSEGVYDAYVQVDNQRYRAAVSVGVSPVFRDTSSSNVEAHLLDFDGSLYGKTLTIEFLAFLRPMQSFDSIDELVSTVEGNIAWVRDNIDA